MDKTADNLQKLSVAFQKHTTFSPKAYYLFSKSILPFPKKHTTFLKRGQLIEKTSPLFKHHLNGIKTLFKRYYNSMEIIRHRPHYNKYYYYGKPPITRESGGKEEGRLSEAEAGVEEAKKAERKKSPAFAGGRKTERTERASGAPSK